MSSSVPTSSSRPASRSACAFSACSNSVRAKRALPKRSPRFAPSRIRRSVSTAPSSKRYSLSRANFSVIATSSSVE